MGRKREYPGKNHLTHPQVELDLSHLSRVELDLSHLWPVWGSNPHQSQRWDDRMVKGDNEISHLNHSATGGHRRHICIEDFLYGKNMLIKLYSHLNEIWHVSFTRDAKWRFKIRRILLYWKLPLSTSPHISHDRHYPFLKILRGWLYSTLSFGEDIRSEIFISSYFRTYVRRYTSPNDKFEYGYPHSNELSNFNTSKPKSRKKKNNRCVSDPDEFSSSQWSNATCQCIKDRKLIIFSHIRLDPIIQSVLNDEISSGLARMMSQISYVRMIYIRKKEK